MGMARICLASRAAFDMAVLASPTMHPFCGVHGAAITVTEQTRAQAGVPIGLPTRCPGLSLAVRQTSKT